MSSSPFGGDRVSREPCLARRGPDERHPHAEAGERSREVRGDRILLVAERGRDDDRARQAVGGDAGRRERAERGLPGSFPGLAISLLRDRLVDGIDESTGAENAAAAVFASRIVWSMRSISTRHEEGQQDTEAEDEERRRLRRAPCRRDVARVPTPARWRRSSSGSVRDPPAHRRPPCELRRCRSSTCAFSYTSSAASIGVLAGTSKLRGTAVATSDAGHERVQQHRIDPRRARLIDLVEPEDRHLQPAVTLVLAILADAPLAARTAASRYAVAPARGDVVGPSRRSPAVAMSVIRSPALVLREREAEVLDELGRDAPRWRAPAPSPLFDVASCACPKNISGARPRGIRRPCRAWGTSTSILARNRGVGFGFLARDVERGEHGEVSRKTPTPIRQRRRSEPRMSENSKTEIPSRRTLSSAGTVEMAQLACGVRGRSWMSPARSRQPVGPRSVACQCSRRQRVRSNTLPYHGLYRRAPVAPARRAPLPGGGTRRYTVCSAFAVPRLGARSDRVDYAWRLAPGRAAPGGIDAVVGDGARAQTSTCRKSWSSSSGPSTRASVAGLGRRPRSRSTSARPTSRPGPCCRSWPASRSWRQGPDRPEGGRLPADQPAGDVRDPARGQRQRAGRRPTATDRHERRRGGAAERTHSGRSAS